jgi:NADH-quinone oxidoreductase subunit M
MLGLFAATQSSMEGAILQMVNHGISTGALFLLVGVIYDRRHTRMLDDFGGLAKVMPVYAAFFVIATLASVGLPGTNGFTGEFLIITGTFVSNKLGHVNGIQAVGAALGVIIAALYMLTAVQKMFFGPITRDENRHLKDINTREILAVAPLIIAIFVIGLAPNILLSQMRDAVARTISDMNSRTEANPAPGYYRGPIKLVARRPDAPKPASAANANPSTAAAPSGADSAP